MNAQTELNTREITLIRVALLQRCDRLKKREDMADSYDESIALLNKLWKLYQGLHAQQRNNATRTAN